MADRPNDGGGAGETPFVFETMLEMQRPALAAMAELNGRLYEGIAAMNSEWTSFLNKRLKEDMAVPEQLAACKSVQDMYRVYTDYFQAACAHYQAGFEQIAKCGRSIAEDTIDVLQSDANSTVRKRQ